MIDNSEIPKMTHPLCSGWRQPPRASILLDDENAYMTIETLEKLPEYSTTCPTGAYEGKMWKRNAAVWKRGADAVWYLFWYGHSEREGYVSTEQRKIVIVDELWVKPEIDMEALSKLNAKYSNMQTCPTCHTEHLIGTMCGKCYGREL